MKSLTTAALGLGLALGMAGCGLALEGSGEGRLGVTARDAFREGGMRAATWDGNAHLRWMEGVSISSTGWALPGVGFWRLHYTAPGRAAGLVVTVGSLQVTEEEQPPAWPQGFTMGDRAVGDTWIDSPEAMTRVLAVRGRGVPESVSMLLVPEVPLQWVVTIPEDPRRWRLNAVTGEVVTP